MTFKKLALASAIALAPMATFAVESLDDAALSEATGQDGIQISLDLAVTTNTIVHDTDGLNDLAGVTTQASYSYAGAIVITGMSIGATGGAGAADGVIVSIDAGDDDTADSAPTLNVNVELVGSVTINTGAISVANSNRDNAAWGTDAPTATIISNAQIILGGATVNIQLANEPQGAMVSLNTAVTNGVTITGGALNDLNSLGSVGAGVVHVEDNGVSTDLTISATADVTATGLEVTLVGLGSGTGIDVQVERVYLGTAPASGTVGYIGDVEMSGLNLAGTVIGITGK